MASLIQLTDPNDPQHALVGGMSNPDPVDWNSVLNGGPINLILDSVTSSGNLEDLFNLTAPPSFSGPYMVWGKLDDNGTLNMFLATSTGDTSFPFAELSGFKDLIMSGGGGAPPSGSGGSGNLDRTNQLPPVISWQLNP